MYLTNIEDTNVDILLSLPYSDLENYCFTNTQALYLCKHNERIQQKLGYVNKIVSNIIYEARKNKRMIISITDLHFKGVLKINESSDQPKLLVNANNVTLSQLYDYMDKYNIMLSKSNIDETVLKGNVIKIRIYIISQTDKYIHYTIIYKKDLKWVEAYLNTLPLTDQQIKDFLFAIFYDELLT
jgi:hypothetical protein